MYPFFMEGSMSKLKAWIKGKTIVIKKTFNLSKNPPKDIEESIETAILLAWSRMFVAEVVELLQQLGGSTTKKTRDVLDKGKKLQDLFSRYRR